MVEVGRKNLFYGLEGIKARAKAVLEGHSQSCSHFTELSSKGAQMVICKMGAVKVTRVCRGIMSTFICEVWGQIWRLKEIWNSLKFQVQGEWVMRVELGRSGNS
jgi:hypothetical protein